MTMETDWLQVEGSFGSDRCRLLGEKEIDQRSELDRLCEQARYKRSKVTGPTCRWLMCGPQSVRTSSSPCCEWPEVTKRSASLGNPATEYCQALPAGMLRLCEWHWRCTWIAISARLPSNKRHDLALPTTLSLLPYWVHCIEAFCFFPHKRTSRQRKFSRSRSKTVKGYYLTFEAEYLEAARAPV